jgi:isopentenyldiphosphate isomerase
MGPEIKAYLAASAAELVIHVDEADQPLGVTERGSMQRKGLIPRCTFIFVFSSAGQLCVHQRTAHKRLYPGAWDVAAGGVVAAGETYLEGATRELCEELGVSGVELTAHFRFFYQSRESRLWGSVFSCTWDGILNMQPEEVAAVRWVDPRQSWQRQDERYAPDSLQALGLLLSGYTSD